LCAYGERRHLESTFPIAIKQAILTYASLKVASLPNSSDPT
jgi:hypothetical protein